MSSETVSAERPKKEAELPSSRDVFLEGERVDHPTQPADDVHVRELPEEKHSPLLEPHARQERSSHEVTSFGRPGPGIQQGGKTVATGSSVQAPDG